MKRISVFLMFLILVSGMAYSRTVYLVVPDSASDLTYYAVDENASQVTLTSGTTESSYMGNSNLDLVSLETSTEDAFKLMATYNMDGKYYFLISSDTDTESDDNLENFASTYSLSNVYTEFGSYADYPGIKILEDMRLSMIPITGKFTEFTDGTIDKVVDDETTYTDVVVKGYAGISPNNAKTFTIKEEGSDSETVYKSLKEISDPIKYSYTDDDGNDHYTVKVTYAQFRAKNTDSSTFTYNGKVDSNTTYTLTGDMELDLYSQNSGEGQYWMDISPTGGSTVVLIDDIGVTAEEDMATTSKSSEKSKSRYTNIETSLVDTDNFTIKNIKE